MYKEIKSNLKETLNLDECEILNEMATIGQDNNGYVYMIYKKEGVIPHFHILKDNKTIQCIRIDKPYYFSHNGKYSYKLNSKERKELVSFLNRLHFSKRPNNTMTNWEFLLSQWNIENNTDINEDLVIPDYTKLKMDK